MGTGMSVALAVALLALLVAAFTLVALIAVYARVRGLEAASGDTGLSGYATLVGRPAPASVRPGPGEGCSLVAVLDGDCTLCATVFHALTAVNAADDVRVVALTDRIHDPRRRAPGSSASTSRRVPTCTRDTRPRSSPSTPAARSSPAGSSTPTPTCRNCCASSSPAPEPPRTR